MIYLRVWLHEMHKIDDWINFLLINGSNEIKTLWRHLRLIYLASLLFSSVVV